MVVELSGFDADVALVADAQRVHLLVVPVHFVAGHGLVALLAQGDVPSAVKCVHLVVGHWNVAFAAGTSKEMTGCFSSSQRPVE